MLDYRREIDGLRAIAVLPVIFFHAGIDAFQGGFVGVDVFFVISGYLITSIILNERALERFSLINFYERRARRILPALFAMVASVIPLAWIWLLPRDMVDFAESVAAVALFVSNHLFYSESGYFDQAAELKPLLHTWSLSVEEQYYLLFPLLIGFMWRFPRRWTVKSLVVIACLSLVAAELLIDSRPAAAFFLLPARAWELAIGALVAFYWADRSRVVFPRWLKEAGGVLGVLLIGVAVFAFSSATPFPGLYALVPTLGTAMIILFASAGTLVGRLLTAKLLVTIGLLSYSAYLWHQPIFVFARHSRSIDFSFGSTLGLIALTFALAYLSWRFIEQPCRHRGVISRKTIFSMSLIGSILLVIFGYVGIQQKGFEQRFERVVAGDIGHLDFHRYIDEKFHDCQPASIARQALKWDGFLRCKQSRQGMPDVVLFGDSHAEHLFIGLAEARSDLNVAFYISTGKPYLSNSSYTHIFDELLSNKKSQKVLLAMHYTSGTHVNTAQLFQELSNTISKLQLAGKKVVLLGDVPKFSIDPGYCVYKDRLGQLSNGCVLSAAEVTSQRESYRSTLIEISQIAGVTYLDIDGPLCADNRCAMVSGHNVLYRDRNHLNIYGSQLVGSALSKRLGF